MTVVVVTPRSDALLIDIDTIKKHLKVEHVDDDDLITLYAQGVTSWLDGPAGWMGHALGPQTLSAELCAPASRREIPLPFPPVTSIEEITWVDASGETQTVPDDEYELFANRVRLTPGSAWRARLLTVKFIAGYAANSLPKDIAAAILLMTGDLYANRETAVVGTISASVAMTTTAERLLSPYCVRRV